MKWFLFGSAVFLTYLWISEAMKEHMAQCSWRERELGEPMFVEMVNGKPVVMHFRESKNGQAEINEFLRLVGCK